MSARALFEADRLDEAIETLGAELRRDPTDDRRRTFLFELLCFAGQLDRAEKHLDVIARGSREAEMGAWLYRSALHAERTRQERFLAGAPADAGAPTASVSGLLDGRPFTSIADADPRIGARLELFAAGEYVWIPFEHLASVHIPPPKRLRDLLWAPATVRVGPGFEGVELGEVLLPALAPLSWRESVAAVRLGRTTDVRVLEDGTETVVGQKVLLVDDEVVPLLEIRVLEFGSPSAREG